MTGEGTISFYSLEIKQTGDGGTAQGLTSHRGRYDEGATEAALAGWGVGVERGDPGSGLRQTDIRQLCKAIENILIEVHLNVLKCTSWKYRHEFLFGKMYISG